MSTTEHDPSLIFLAQDHPFMIYPPKSFVSLFLLLFIFTALSGQSGVTISGSVADQDDLQPIAYASILLLNQGDSSFVSGTTSAEDGNFSLENITPGNYLISVTYVGYTTKSEPLFVGSSSRFLDVNTLFLATSSTVLEEVEVTARASEVSSKLDKKTFTLEDNTSQMGGSVLQAMQNLPGITVQDGKIQLRGSDKLIVLIDGKQTALTGFGNQTGLDNIPASAIEKIEIINNPSAKYDANGNAGIINIIYKKNRQEGINGKAGLTTGLGSLWERKANLPTIRSQYTFTPKINPSISLNYRKDKVNAFFNGDYLYTETLNKNEFVVRTYDDGEVINQQLKRNRNTHFTTLKAGVDVALTSQSSLTVSGLFGNEKIIDRGDQPFFNKDFSERNRLWQFLEDELKTTWIATANYQHRYREAGHILSAGFNYTFHREDEQYFYDNFLPTSTGKDAFKLLSDEQVYDFNLDYQKPLKYGHIETGVKLRRRDIPTNMQFIPGANSVLDADAGGAATYRELIPAVYGSYIFETPKWEAEVGLRVEYVRIDYEVNPDHPTYSSDGYDYTQPFPNIRLGYKLNDRHRLSVFYNRRVDRPNEVDIRIFPKYDDAEIIKVGNPALRPQFTNSLELGYKNSWETGSWYGAVYHKFADGTTTRISSIVDNSNLIYAIYQNVNKSYNTGVEMVITQDVSSRYTFNFNINAYHNQIDAYTVENLYPVPHLFSAPEATIYSGNVKLNNSFHFNNDLDLQVTLLYLAPDIIPQGEIQSRFSMDIGAKKSVQNGQGEIFLNASDLLGTMVIRRTIQGQGFSYTSDDYYETQVVRLGYSRKF